MAEPNSESLQESKDTNSPRTMEVLQHVPQKLLDIKDEKENKSFSKWMKCREYDNCTGICADFCHILDRIHDYSEFRADGLRRALKFSTMNKIRMFTYWMGTKMTDGFFELYAETVLEQFNDFRQADMIRMIGLKFTTTWINYTYDHLVWIYNGDCVEKHLLMIGLISYLQRT